MPEKKPRRLWADGGNAFECEECHMLTPRSLSDVMGDSERHETTCSQYDPKTRNFKITIRCKSKDSAEKILKSLNTKEFDVYMDDLVAEESLKSPVCDVCGRPTFVCDKDWKNCN